VIVAVETPRSGQGHHAQPCRRRRVVRVLGRALQQSLRGAMAPPPPLRLPSRIGRPARI